MSVILSNPSQHSDATVRHEKQRVIRVTMNKLLYKATKRGDLRPADDEIRETARLLCSKYKCLRDDPERDVLNNQVNYNLFLTQIVKNIATLEYMNNYLSLIHI